MWRALRGHGCLHQYTTTHLFFPLFTLPHLIPLYLLRPSFAPPRAHTCSPEHTPVGQHYHHTSEHTFVVIALTHLISHLSLTCPSLHTCPAVSPREHPTPALSCPSSLCSTLTYRIPVPLWPSLTVTYNLTVPSLISAAPPLSFSLPLLMGPSTELVCKLAVR